MGKRKDESEIRELVARYADAVTRRDEKAWGATWSEDGRWTLMGRSVEGRDNVVALWNQMMGGLSFVTQIPTHGILSIRGKKATARWYITEHGTMAGDGGPILNLGVYHDEYRKGPEGWRFASRRFDIMYVGPPDLSATVHGFPTDAPALED